MWGLLVILMGCTGWSASADEGRIPIFQPATITQSGSYVLTRDLIGTFAQPILIVQAKDVTIDLNGYRIIDSGDSGGIRIDSPTQRLRVRNGTIESGFTPVFSTVGVTLELDGVSNSGYFAVNSSQTITLRIQRSQMTGRGFSGALRLGSGSTVDVSDSYLSGDYLLNCNGACGNSRFVNNLLLVVFTFGDGGTGLLLDHNTLKSGDGGINVLYATTNCRISSNSFYGTVSITGDGNLIDGNQFIGSESRMIVTSNQNRIINNQISGTTSHGIEISGSTNLVEGNSVTGGNAFGLFFVGGTGNAYKNNFFMNNASGAVGGSLAGQTNGGGNIP